MSWRAELRTLVLDPLKDRSDGEWERGPAGKWTPAQIVEHLAAARASASMKDLQVTACVSAV